MEPRERLRSIIVALRKSKGMSQRALADSLGLSPGAVQGWERTGKPTFPDLDSLIALATLRGQTLEELIAEVCGRSFVPTQGKSWAELGREAIADQAILRELLSELDAEELAQVVAAAISLQGDILRS